MKRRRYEPKFTYALTTVMGGCCLFAAGACFRDAIVGGFFWSAVSAFFATGAGVIALYTQVRAWYTNGYAAGIDAIAQAIEADVAIDVKGGKFGGVIDGTTLAPGESKTIHFRVPIRPFGDRGRNN